ncbi:MAG: hypothetical protein KAR19_17945 [Bacteroidales bacterium]|nr:hypothetical protein [Bacteroidales bacterium]
MQVIFDIQKKAEVASNGYRLSIENVLQVGFNLFRKSPGIFIIYSIAGVVALSNPISGLLLSGPLITGYYIAAHRIKHNRPVELPDFFKSFDRFVPLLILNLLMTLVIFLGLILLIIPGIYFAINYLFAHFFVWFYDVDPTEAIRLSRKMVSGNFGQILLLCLVLGGINFLGMLAFGVGILLTLPLSYCVVYAAFDDIIGIP